MPPRRATRRHARRPSDPVPGWAFLLGFAILVGGIGLIMWARGSHAHAPLAEPTSSRRVTPTTVRASPSPTPPAMPSQPSEDATTVVVTGMPQAEADPLPASPDDAPPVMARITPPARAVQPSVAPSLPPEPPVFSPAWRNDAKARHGTGTSMYPVHDESWTIASPMEVYPTLTVDVCVPLGGDGAPLATAADIMLSFPYPTEESAVQGMVRVLATRYGFTLLTIRFPPPETLGINIPAGRHREYYFPEYGSDKAWIDAIGRAQRRFGFPVRKVFATGRSGGGSSVHQFTEAHPGLVEGYHSEAGRYFTERPGYTGPTLLTFGEGDVVDANTRMLINGLVSINNSPWVFPFHTDQRMRERNHPNKRHCISEPAAACAWAWLAGIADLRLDHQGTLPPRARWTKTGANGLPSKHCAELAEKVTPASEVLPGNNGWIVRPAGTPRAVIALSWRDIMMNPDELWMDGHLLSDQGYLAVVGADSGDVIVSTARKLADKARLPLIVLVTDADAKALKDVATAKPEHLILIKPRPALATGWKKPRIPVLCYPSASTHALWEPLADEAVSIAALPVGATHPGAWHVQVMRDIVTRLDRAFPVAQRSPK